MAGEGDVLRERARALFSDLAPGRHEFTNTDLRREFDLARVTVADRERVVAALRGAGFVIKDPGDGESVVVERPPDATADGHSSKRSPLVWALVVAVAVLVLGAASAAAYLVGQGTRKSDAQVAVEQRAAVDAAVKVAIKRNNDENRAARRRALERLENRLKRRNRVVIRRVVRRLKKSAQRRAEQSFASGSQSGYRSGSQAGFEAGEQAGVIKGSDDLVCSDDPDVTFLPPCS